MHEQLSTLEYAIVTTEDLGRNVLTTEPMARIVLGSVVSIAYRLPIIGHVIHQLHSVCACTIYSICSIMYLMFWLVVCIILALW